MPFRIFISLCVAAFVASTAGVSLWRAKTLMERELGVLTGQVDALDADWDSKSVPERGRSLTILLSDARDAFDPFLIRRRDEGFSEKAGAWIGRNLVGGAAVSPAPTALVRGFSDSTVLVSWTHDGFTSFGEEAMAREIEKAVLKAHDAGAEINIVAQGRDAAVVLVALERLKGQVRGGQKVGANKVVLLGASPSVKPDNVIELAGVWSTREIGATLQIQVFGGGMTGATMDLEEYWPGLSSGADSIDKSVRLIQRSVENPRMISELIRVQQAFVDEVRAKKAAEAEARAAAAAAAVEAREKTRAKETRKAELAKAAAETRKTATPPAPARKRPPTNAGPGSMAQDMNWPSAAVLDYSQTMEGTDTGWLVSGPSESIKQLTAEYSHVRTSVSTDGTRRECSQHVQLKTRPLTMLSGRSDAAVQQLFEKHSKRDPHPPAEKVTRHEVHGHPARVFKTVGGSETRSYLVIEAENYLVYLVLWDYSEVKPGQHDYCVDASENLYQGIAQSLRPR